DERPSKHVFLPHIYNIPLRSLISKNIDNLMFAGRNISASHVAFGSTRVMATCAVMGQAAGTAAAYAAYVNKQVAELTATPEDIRAVQEKLVRDDCYIIGVKNEDKRDLAKNA